MATNFSFDERSVAVSKTVREMSLNFDEPPAEYVVKDFNFGSKQSSSPTSIPIIDVSLLSSQDELEKLKSALSLGGCFQAIGHGISSSFLEKVRRISKEFFELPEEEKQKYARAANQSDGYGNDIIVSEKQVLDWSYRLTLRVLPKDARKLFQWPENPREFSQMLDEYTTKIKLLMDILYRSMAKSLNLEEGSFLNQFGERSLLQARFNFYPPSARPDLVFGVKPHTDRSGITVLLQDTEVEGLQILVDDVWVDVPTIPDALVVNLGDQMQIMSNGTFKSPMHRVLTNTEKLRISVALFHEPAPENFIGPVEALIDETRPRLYKNVKNYGFINYKCYQEGKIALETVKVDQIDAEN